jgi:hypothetical protein
MRFVSIIAKAVLVASFIFIGFVVFKTLQNNPTVIKDVQKENAVATQTTEYNSLASNGDVSVGGSLSVKGDTKVLGSVSIGNVVSLAKNTSGKVLTLDGMGSLVLVTDQVGSQTATTTTVTQVGGSLPTTADTGATAYFNGTSWLASNNLYNIGGDIGIHSTSPSASLHVDNQTAAKIVSIFQGADGQTASLTEWRNHTGTNVASIGPQGKLSIRNTAADHSIELYPTADAGYLSSSGGAFFLDNTYNLGTGIGIYSDADDTANGNMINIKVDNPLFQQAAFYMSYDGTSNAVEIVSNSTDTSSNALAVTGNNANDSTVGIIGYETGRGTVKISHNGTGSDSNASGISIDLKGTGTRAQGLYIDSTATGGTSGNLLRLRNQTIDRFVVGSTGSLTMGSTGTNSSFTKEGNTSGDQFFIGTNGAFRVQRSATDSEAFRTQVNGDTQGRWLGTSDGKLKFGSGSATQDVVLQRTGAGLFQMATDIEIDSQSTSNVVLELKASDASSLAKFNETSGGAGTLDISDASGVSQVVLAADGTNSYVLTGNFGVGTSSSGTNAVNVLALGNGTAPSTSIANGIQLYAEDVAASSELRVRDEAGNVTTLSPHNFSLIPEGPSEPLAWSYYSQNNDVAINVDILKAIRTLESLSQTQLVYEKNLVTGEVVNPNTSVSAPSFIGVSPEYLSEAISSALVNTVSKKEFDKHVSLVASVWNFLTDVVFKSKAIFEKSADFLASVVFKGSITVNADTAGQVIVPANVTRFKVSFTHPFFVVPIVYLSSNQSGFHIESITTESFEVVTDKPLATAQAISWIALLSEKPQSSNLTILESSEKQPDIQTSKRSDIVKEPQTIILAEPVASQSASPSAESIN